MKISIPLVKYLQENKQLDHFTQEYDTLHMHDTEGKAYANTIAGCLDIAYSLNNLKVPYCIIGGLAVAFHVHQVDHNAFLKWRGTHDIDILVQKSLAEKVLKESGYSYRHIMRGKRGALKGIYEYAKDDNGESLALGLREYIQDQAGRDITDKLLQHAASIDLYSIPVKVPMIRDLVAMKRHANRTKDRGDISLLRKHYPAIKL